MIDALFILSDFDKPTDVMEDYFRWYMRRLKNIHPNFTYAKFKSAQVDPEILARLVKRYRPRILIFESHGNIGSILGYRKKPLVVAGINDRIFRGKIIYSMSCDSGKLLGKIAILNGAKAFIGYKGRFSFPEPTRPYIKDKRLYPYMAVALYPVILLAREKYTPEQIYRKTLALYKEILKGRMGKVYNRDLLVSNLKNFVYYGGK